MPALRQARRSCFSSWRASVRSFTASSSLATTYGFIGLGRMGYPMAGNLRSKIASTDKLVVFDVNATATSTFRESNANTEIAASTREVAEKSDTIITVLPEPQHVRKVYEEMLAGATLPVLQATPERLFIDCSTIDPMTSSDVAQVVHSTKQGSFADAPMSGGVVGAQAGQLTFMVGTVETLLPRIAKVLSLMGKRVLHMGPPTSGLKAKLANNYLLALNNVATAEAMNMGIQWGLDPKALADMINISTGRCWPSEINNPVPDVVATAPASRGYEGGFGTALMNKDLKLAIKAAEEHGIEARLGPGARDVYDSVEATAALKGKDFSVVYKWLQSKSKR